MWRVAGRSAPAARTLFQAGRQAPVASYLTSRLGDACTTPAAARVQPGSAPAVPSAGWQQSRSFGLFSGASWFGGAGGAGDDDTGAGLEAGTPVDVVEPSFVEQAVATAHVDTPMASEGVGGMLSSLQDSALEACVAVSPEATTSALEGAGWGPVVLAMRAIEAGHIYLGLPWWGSIALASVGLRLVVMPLYYKGLRSGAKMKVLQPKLKKVQERMKWAQGVGDQHQMTQARAAMLEMYKKNDINPLTTIGAALLQIPGFILFVWALRRMTDNAADFLGWTEGGALWFLDLSVPDPYYSLPILSACINLATVQINKNIQDTPQMKASTMKMLFRGFAVAVVPLTAMLPVSLHIYFVTTSISMFTMTASQYSLSVRRFWGLPDEWPVVAPTEAEVEKPKVTILSGLQGAAPPPPPPPPSGTIDMASSSDAPPAPPSDTTIDVESTEVPPPSDAADAGAAADAAAARTTPPPPPKKVIPSRQSMKKRNKRKKKGGRR